MKYDSKPMPPPMILISLIASFLIIVVPYLAVWLFPNNGHLQGAIILSVCVLWILSAIGVGVEYLYWKNKEQSKP